MPNQNHIFSRNARLDSSVGAPQARQADTLIEGSSRGLGSKLRLVANHLVMLWKAALAGFFFAGFIAAIIWTGGKEGFEQTYAQSLGQVSIRVAAQSDDAEQRVSSGKVALSSSDLEFIRDGSNDQTVGLRFRNITIPPKARITNAYIELMADEVKTGVTNLTFWGQAADNPATFTTSRNNVSNRPKTTASVNWNNVPAWNTVGAVFQTPNLASLIQEIVNRQGWASGNSMVIIATGSGTRTAESYEGGSSKAPRLVIAYMLDTPPTRSNGAPSGILPSGTIQTVLSLSTDENAVCKYSASAGVDYLAMTNTFSTTGAISHATTISGLTNGSAYTYYVKCQDQTGNANTDDYSISFSVASDTASACNRYVSTTGSDTNPGTQSQPWRTMNHAAGTVQAGTTVCVQAGTYNERVQVTASGSLGQPITFEAQGEVITQGFTVSAQYVTIRGFTADGAWATCSGDNSWGILYEGAYGVIENNYVTQNCGGGILLYTLWNDTNNPNTHTIVVKNNRAYRNRMTGIEVRGRNHRVEDNTVWGTVQTLPDGSGYTSSSDADGIRFFGSGHVFARNHIYDITYTNPLNIDPHIDCFQSWGPADNVVFERNFCETAGPGSAIGAVGKGFMLQGVSNLMIKNNIITGMRALHCENATNVSYVHNLHESDYVNYSNAQWGPPASSQNCPGIVIKNNIFYNPHEYGTQTVIYSYGQTIDADYNNVYRTDGKIPLGSPAAHDLWGIDPKLINPGAGDYHLQSNSPLMNAGTAISGVTDDYEGVSRPRGSGYDIGPYEF